MKIFGYANEMPNNLVSLNQITIQADSKSLKILAEFLTKCAEDMDKDSDWEHEHFTDFVDEEIGKKLESDIVIFKGNVN